MNVYPREYLAENEVKEESWSTGETPDAKKLRDSRARVLRKEGWTVETARWDFSDLARCVSYSLTATRQVAQ